MRLRALCAKASCLAILAAAPAEAQVAWEAPLLVAPGTPSGLGLYLTDPHPGDLLAVMVTYRAQGAPGGLGWRVGVTEERRDRIALFGGVDVSGLIRGADAEFPLDLIWVSGVGASTFDDVFTVSVPLAMMAGRTLDSENADFTPYVGPRIVLDGTFGDGSDGLSNDDASLEVAVDFGVDLAFDEAWMIRFAATLGDRDALAIGVVIGARD